MRTQASEVGPATLAPERLDSGEVKERLRISLLLCGIASTVYYAAINVYVPTRCPGYSSLSQAVSELSAIGAPTRDLWVLLCVPYTLMVIAFGCGVWMSGADRRPIRVVGALFVTDAILGAYWPPMHLRDAATSLTDTLHIAWTAGWLLLMLGAMGFAAAAMGRRFRFYTAGTLVAFLVFGVLTSIEAGQLAADLPTPFLGLWERINMGVAMLWVAVLGVALLRRDIGTSPTRSA